MLFARTPYIDRSKLVHEDRGAPESGKTVTDLYAAASFQKPVRSAGAILAVYAFAVELSNFRLICGQTGSQVVVGQSLDLSDYSTSHCQLD